MNFSGLNPAQFALLLQVGISVLWGWLRFSVWADDEERVSSLNLTVVTVSLINSFYAGLYT